MKKFSVILELESKYQSGTNIGKVFACKSEISFAAADEQHANALIQENFGQRIPPGVSYAIVCEGDAPAGAKEGFTISPLG